MEKKCPHCGSANTYYSKKKQKWICEDCEKNFINIAETTCIKQDLTSSDFWCKEMWNVAPVALSLSYRQLYDYVQEEKIGCTLFLIRDVFELLIKIPVTILFNAVHELCDVSNDFQQSLAKSPKLSKLYEYSMQMLSTGKWWECVRIASNLHEDFSNYHLSSGEIKLYSETIKYLRMLHKSLYYNSGSGKTNMVTWRNRTLGHSCLADNPYEKYDEIPYILKMFKSVGEQSLRYYRHISLANSKMEPLCGIGGNNTEPEIYIKYFGEEDKTAAYIKLHSFIAGRECNLACFDGYEKGKAYLLNYNNGERYKDLQLSNMLEKHCEALIDLKKQELSDGNIFADNLESMDIQQLENVLSAQDELIGFGFLYKWIINVTKTTDKGLLLLTGERGLGKTVFCKLIDQLNQSKAKFSDDSLLEIWGDFSENTAIRVWHFNSEYRSRKDIFIPGIRDTLLTLSAEYSAEGYQYNANKLCGRLETQFDNLITCNEDLRSLYFAECLNDLLEEYQARTDKQKLILVLDGIDEVEESAEILSFIPSLDMLHKDLYILLTCRTHDEICNNSKLIEYIDCMKFSHKLEYTRKNIVSSSSNNKDGTVIENSDYNVALKQYIANALCEQNKPVTIENTNRISNAFEYRFSSIAAYRKLCRLNPIFFDATEKDLFSVFMEQIEKNAPHSYVEKIKAILNTLVCAGEPLTLRELAYLSGERYVSYRMLGMLNDLQAFVKISRTKRGNCYEISHAQWTESIKELIPYGGIYYRKQCNDLIKELAHSFHAGNIELILENSYEGEFWLLSNILKIYNQNWKELKENWFEEINMVLYEKIITLILNNNALTDKMLIKNSMQLYDIMAEYVLALQMFGHTLTFTVNPIIQKVVEIYEKKATQGDYDKKLVYYRLAADTLSLAAKNISNDEKKRELLEKSKAYYSGQIELLKGYGEDTDLERIGLCLYKMGRIDQILGYHLYALHNLSEFVMITSRRQTCLNTKDNLCRAYIRMGNICVNGYDETMDARVEGLKYLHMGLEYSKQLLQEKFSAVFLETKSWSERSISKYYEYELNFDEAIKYRHEELNTIEHLISIEKKQKYFEDKYNSLKKT